MFSELWAHTEREQSRPTPASGKPPSGKPHSGRPAARSCIGDCLGNRDSDDGVQPRFRKEVTELEGLDERFERTDSPSQAPDFFVAPKEAEDSGRSTNRELPIIRQAEAAEVLHTLRDQHDEDVENESEDGSASSRSRDSEEEYQKKLRDCQKKLQKNLKKVQAEVEDEEDTEHQQYVLDVSMTHAEVQKNMNLRSNTGDERQGASSRNLTRTWTGDTGIYTSQSGISNWSGDEGLRRTATLSQATASKPLAEVVAEGLDIDMLDSDDPEAIHKYYEQGWEPQHQHKIGHVVGVPEQVDRLRWRMKHEGTDMPEDYEDADEARTVKRQLEITFEIQFKKHEKPMSKRIVFRRKPLGIKWYQFAPITISVVKENGYAWELGVRKGWIIKAINGENCDHKWYNQISIALLKEVAALPTDAQLSGRSRTRGKYQAMTQKVTVIFEAAKNIPAELAVGEQFFCTCEIPGKPHSRVHTRQEPEGGFEKNVTAPIPGWHESHNLFDYNAGDPLLFKMYKQIAAQAGIDRKPEQLIGFVQVPNADFCPRGLHMEHPLWDKSVGLPVDIKLQARILVKDVPVKTQVIEDYMTLMNGKFEKLFDQPGVEETAFKELGGYDTDPATAVRVAVQQYHRQSEEIQKWYPFPGKQEDQFLDQERLGKLKAFEKYLKDTEGGMSGVTVKYQANATDGENPFKFVQDTDDTNVASSIKDSEENVSQVKLKDRARTKHDVDAFTVGETYEVQASFLTSDRFEKQMIKGQTGVLKQINEDGSGVFEFQTDGQTFQHEVVNADMQFFSEKKDRVGSSLKVSARSLKIVFLNNGVGGLMKKQKTVVFRERPLNIQMDKKAPIKICDVRKDSYAAKEGVSVGWTIVKLDDTDVQRMSYEDQSRLLYAKLSSLPDLTKQDT